MNKRLSIQLFIAALLSLLLAFGVFSGVYLTGAKLLNQTIYLPTYGMRRTDRAFAELQSYISEEAITPDDLSPLDGWRHSIHFHLYVDGRILYDSIVESDGTLTGNYQLDAEEPSHAYDLKFADGTRAAAYLYYTPGNRYFLVGIGATVAALLVFTAAFLSMVHRKVRYIQQLQADLAVLSGGNLDYSVTRRGKDELTELAEGIDAMRCSILAHQRAEEDMRTANAQLVTAMSHDLRTPLTTLLAYLELVERGKYADEAQLQSFIGRSLDKTYQIRDMADKLFEYFLVNSTSWEKPDMETVGADACLRQFWGEYAFSLESKGFCVQADFPTLCGTLRVNLDLLRRVFDNLYSNLLKYADPTSPICLRWQQEDSRLLFEVCNAVPAQPVKAGTNIGLGTCRRVLALHNGTFEVHAVEGRFSARLTLPLFQEDQP